MTKIKLELRSIPALTVDEEAYLVREHYTFPWKRMTKSQIEDQYPGAFDNEGPSEKTKTDAFSLPRENLGTADITPLSPLPTLPSLK